MTYDGRLEAQLAIPAPGFSLTATTPSGGAATVNIPPNAYYPSDLGSELATLLNGYAPTTTYPTTAADLAEAVGFGTWSSGWLCDDNSGNLAPAFGSLTLTAANGSPTYRNAGPLTNDYAIGLATTSDEFDGGASDFDVGSTDDVVFLWVGKWSSIPSSDLAILGKVSSAFANGYVLSGFGGSGFGFGAGPNGDYISRASNYLVGRWHIGIAAVDRANNALRIGVCALDDGTISLGSVQTPGATSFSTANVFSVGHGGWVGSETTFELASLFGGKGTGVATGIPTNMATALANFRTRLLVPGWTVALSTGATGTLQWTLDCAATPFSIAWGADTTLRDLLGFTADITAATSPATGAKQGRGLWMPDCPLYLTSDPRAAPVGTDLRQTASPTGRVLSLVGDIYYLHQNITWQAVPSARIWEGLALLPNASWEFFFNETQLGRGLSWFTPGSKLRIYDHTGTALGILGNFGAGVDGWQITGLSNIAPTLTQAPWTGLYSIVLPQLLSSGS